MWDLPGPGLEPLSPVPAGRILTTVPPGKSLTFLTRGDFSDLVLSPFLDLSYESSGRSSEVGMPVAVEDLGHWLSQPYHLVILRTGILSSSDHLSLRTTCGSGILKIKKLIVTRGTGHARSHADSKWLSKNLIGVWLPPELTLFLPNPLPSPQLRAQLVSTTCNPYSSLTPVLSLRCSRELTSSRTPAQAARGLPPPHTALTRAHKLTVSLSINTQYP